MSTPRLTAAELVAHPERIAEVDPSEAAKILAQLVTVSAALTVRLPIGANGHHVDRIEAADCDRLLTAKEAAAILQVSPDFLRRSPVAKPFRVYVGRELRFSWLGVQRYIRRHAGRE